MKLKRWKTTEEKVLRDNYRHIGAEACADLLGRSVSSVFTRAWMLGVTETQSTAQRKARFRKGLA